MMKRGRQAVVIFSGVLLHPDFFFLRYQETAFLLLHFLDIIFNGTKQSNAGRQASAPAERGSGPLFCPCC